MTNNNLEAQAGILTPSSTFDMKYFAILPHTPEGGKATPYDIMALFEEFNIFQNLGIDKAASPSMPANVLIKEGWDILDTMPILGGEQGVVSFRSRPVMITLSWCSASRASVWVLMSPTVHPRKRSGCILSPTMLTRTACCVSLLDSAVRTLIWPRPCSRIWSPIASSMMLMNHTEPKTDLPRHSGLYSRALTTWQSAPLMNCSCRSCSMKTSLATTSRA